ncbi:MAG: LytTR family DNA-binding domain-containing protein [Burkholderiaceae bacterium]|nr:LytTR family DNA-binding domain-containing protein [Burkholderiaceae bacterium]
MNQTVTALIADDERLMREQIQLRLNEVWPELKIVAEAKNGAEAVDLIAQHTPQVAFLDIRMPGMTGIEAAGHITNLPNPPHLVFVTAYDEYAISAFERGAIDYVLKPAENARLKITVERIKSRLATHTPVTPALDSLLSEIRHALGDNKKQYMRWIQAQVGAQLRMIPVTEVLFFISDEKYTRVQTEKLEALIRKPIRELVENLDPEVFWQIHRSTLVNINKIAGVSNDERGHKIISILGHPEKLEVSRSYLHLFKQM